MLENLDVIAIAALLPLTAAMLVTQVNPYHALVIRGILGAVAALVYALFGAADVALTEALVGTMLSITLYAIAVRSSMSLRLGVLEEASDSAAATAPNQYVYSALRKILNKYHMRLEVLPYPTLQSLQFALENKEIHATCVRSEQYSQEQFQGPETIVTAPYLLNVRLQRLYEIVQGAMPAAIATVSFSRALRLMPSGHQSTSPPLQKALES
jgi:putative multicomponent Na+:H+ antiporter subunit B